MGSLRHTSDVALYIPVRSFRLILVGDSFVLFPPRTKPQARRGASSFSYQKSIVTRPWQTSDSLIQKQYNPQTPCMNRFSSPRGNVEVSSHGGLAIGSLLHAAPTT